MFGLNGNLTPFGLKKQTERENMSPYVTLFYYDTMGLLPSGW